jgi:TetR/AcrR family transcriptional regulator
MPRRIGAPDSRTRARLLDAAEQLMLEEGYAAVTSRHVGRKAEISPQLVHYYFRTMDDLFLEVFRRRAEQGLVQFTDAIAAAPTLRTLWEFRTDPHGSAFNIEFAALSNHRKAIRAELALYAERFRQMQLDAIAAILAARGISTDSCPPAVVLLAITGITQVMAFEEAFGMTTGHDETIDFVGRFLDDLEVTPGRATPDRGAAG